MSITTKTGDDGTTAVLFGRRVAKTHQRVVASGAVDELNAALGMARAVAEPELAEEIARIQKGLIAFMGEVAVLAEDRERFVQTNLPKFTPQEVTLAEQRIAALEARGVKTDGWDTPGRSPAHAALHYARAVCRRAEREVLRCGDELRAGNPYLMVYLNRLSDLLWLMAQHAD